MVIEMLFLASSEEGSDGVSPEGRLKEIPGSA